MHIQPVDHGGSKLALPEICWALEVTSPPTHVLAVIEVSRTEGEPPALHHFLRLPLGGSADAYLASNGWRRAHGGWIPRTWGRICRVVPAAVRDGD